MDDALGAILLGTIALTLVTWMVAFYWTVRGEQKSGITLTRQQFARSIFKKSVIFFAVLCGTAMIVSLGFFAFVLIPALIVALIASGILYSIALLLYPYHQSSTRVLWSSAALLLITIATGLPLASKLDQQREADQVRAQCEYQKAKLSPEEFERFFSDYCNL